MKTISASLKDHLASDLLTVALCAKVVRTDAVEFFFTAHHEQIEYDGDTYETASIITSTNISNSSNASVDNLDAQIFFNSLNITEPDVVGGLWNNADVSIFIINYMDTSQGILKVFRGRLGEKNIHDESMTMELRSLTQLLQQRIGRTYNRECDAYVGDSRCGVNLVPFTVTGTVTTFTDRKTFTDTVRIEADDWFNFGTLTWTSGNNNGLSMEVKDFSAGQFILFESMPGEIQISDGYSVHAGCDRLDDTCKTKFDNYVNNRGIPHLPGIDRMVTMFK